MNHGRHAGIGEDFCQRRGVILMRVHAAGRYQPDQMTGAAAVLQFLDEAGEHRRLCDLAAGDGVADPRQVLHHHAAGADIEMADFGVAHLAVRQSDIVTGGVKEPARPGFPQPIEGRRFGLPHGIVGVVLAPAEAVEDHQHHRPPLLHVGSFQSDNARYCGSM